MTVNCVAPGPQKASFLFGAETDDSLKWLAGQTLSGELGDPRDVVPVVRFLATPSPAGSRPRPSTSTAE